MHRIEIMIDEENPRIDVSGWKYLSRRMKDKILKILDGLE